MSPRNRNFVEAGVWYLLNPPPGFIPCKHINPKFLFIYVQNISTRQDIAIQPPTLLCFECLLRKFVLKHEVIFGITKGQLGSLYASNT